MNILTKTPLSNSLWLIPILLVLVAPLPAPAQVIVIPERFGVVNITPFNQSGETDDNTEPSIGIGTGAQSGKLVVHAFSPNNSFVNSYYVSTNGGTQWVVGGSLQDYDCTMDWSPGGTAYAANLAYPPGGVLQVLSSSDPTIGVPFTQIASSVITGSVDQPWLKVVNIGGVDHIYVGFNNLGSTTGQTASVTASLDGGKTWNTTTVEKGTPGAGWDSPATRLAVSADGKTVYALFQRADTWAGAAFGSDYTGEVVLVRDDESGASGFNALGAGTQVISNARLPWSGGATTGAQRLGGNCAVAINPSQPSTVYVAFTGVGEDEVPAIVLEESTDSGNTFLAKYFTDVATLPGGASAFAMAVSAEGTVGLLYLAKNGVNLEVHLYEAYNGNFNNTGDRVLAKFPNNTPSDTFGQPYVGDYFHLKAVGDNFYGVFTASGDPQASHFPLGVYYQRNVKYGSTITNEFSVTANGGTLVDLAGNAVTPSMDPFFFYDIAPSFITLHILEFVPEFFNDPSDPLNGQYHISWPILPAMYPQFHLQSVMGLMGNWSSADSLVQSNVLFEAPLMMGMPKQFYRLSQNVTGSNFSIFTAVDGNGSLSPSGVVSVPANQSQTFTATPSNYYGIGNWYLDGVVQAASNTLTVSQVTAEHSVLVTFAASNDLAVTVLGMPVADGPTLAGNSNTYKIDLQNVGLNPLTGITMSNVLDPTVTFLSASTTQGSVSQSGLDVTGSIGALNPGAIATVTLVVIPTTAGNITDVVTVACSQFEPNLANNTATDVTSVLEPITITSQPQNVTVAPGGTASFSVGVTGTPPIDYQWYFNGSVLLAGETNTTLRLNNVTTANAGSYSLAIFQVPPGAEDTLQVNSDPAILTVSAPPLLVTEAATSVSSNSAVLNGTIDGNGSYAVAHFRYGTDTNYSLGEPTFSYFTTEYYDVEPFSYTLTGLTPSTTYHYQTFGFNCCVEGYGGDQSFTTGAGATQPPPTVNTLAATSVTETGAVLNGSVNPNGGDSTAFFEWGTDTNYGNITTQTGIGASQESDFQAALTGLNSYTTYHYRMAANNSGGISYGADSNFTTVWAPVPPTLVSPGTSTPGSPGLAVTNPTFSWSGASPASSFDLVIAGYPKGNVVFTGSVGGTSYTLPTGILANATEYQWYMYAFNILGDESSQSGSLYFTTAGLPTVVTLPETNVLGAPYAQLNGSVNPNASAATAYFEYGTTTNYGTITTQTGIGTTPQVFSTVVSGLSAGLTYHYRIDAVNGIGSSQGFDVTFVAP